MPMIFLSHSGSEQALTDAFTEMIRMLRDVILFVDHSPEGPLPDVITGSPGTLWEESIQRALDEMDIFVALVSPSWVNSPWCQKEYKEALRKRVRVFPVYLAPLLFEKLDIFKFEGYIGPGKKAITEARNRQQRQSWVAEAVRSLDTSLDELRMARAGVDLVRDYAAPGVGPSRPPLIIYHCGLRTGEQPPGRLLSDALSELIGPLATTAPPKQHDVTREPGTPSVLPGQTVFVVDSPTTNPVARDVLLNYQRYMVGRKIRHITTLDHGIQVQAIWVDGQEFCSNRHQVALDDRTSGEGFSDYLVVMRLPGIVLNGDFSDEAEQITVWLVYGTTYRGSSAGASLFSRDSFKGLYNWLSQGHQAPPPAFQVVFRVPETPELITHYRELAAPIHFQVLQSLRAQVGGDPVPPALGNSLLSAKETGNYSPVPITAAHLDLVASCNYNCPGCIEAGLRQRGWFLSENKALAVLADLKKHNCHSLSFYGGEPTLHPEFIAIAKAACALGMRPLVVSNGSMFTHSSVFEGVRSLGDQIRIRVSMDAHTEEAYVAQHGPNSRAFGFIPVRNAVVLLARHVPVSISYLVTERNARELAEAIDFWKQTPVRSFNPRLPMGSHGCWSADGTYQSIRTALAGIPRDRYAPDWLVAPDWLWDWVRDGSEPRFVWAFSSCYSAYYRLVISPYLDPPRPVEPLESLIQTNGAWISLCPYHRYEEAFGCPYPDDFDAWCRSSRHMLVDRIKPGWCERSAKTVCSRVPHNTTVQAEINRLRFPVPKVTTPTTA